MAQKDAFQQWSWDQSLAALPSIVTEGLRDEMRIPRAAGFALTSPSFNAPSRYFDNVVLRYRTRSRGSARGWCGATTRPAISATSSV
jgi:hypothetical protein